MTTQRRLRARILLDEATALGLDLADLIAVAHTDPGAAGSIPTLADHVETVAGTFTPGTARAYRSYWRLAVSLLGDRRLDEVTIADLQTVVDHAVGSARRIRPDSPTAGSSTGPDHASTGPPAPPSLPTCCATPPSPPSADSPAIPSPKPLPATAHDRSPASTSTPL